MSFLGNAVSSEEGVRFIGLHDQNLSNVDCYIQDTAYLWRTWMELGCQMLYAAVTRTYHTIAPVTLSGFGAITKTTPTEQHTDAVVSWLRVDERSGEEKWCAPMNTLLCHCGSLDGCQVPPVTRTRDPTLSHTASTHATLSRQDCVDQCISFPTFECPIPVVPLLEVLPNDRCLSTAS